VAGRLVAAAGVDDVVIIGGLAVALHGYVRATDDVDLLCRGPLEIIRKRLAAKGIATRHRRGDATEGDFPCLRGELDGIPFDVLPQIAPVDWTGSPTVKISGVTARIVDLAGLLTLKLRAQGPQDLLDAAALILLHPEVQPEARRLATAYGIEARLKTFLESPRLLAQIRRR